MDDIADIEKIQKYLQNSTHYYENSQDLLKRKELGKAGELLWGAIAEAAKALHLMVKGSPLNHHVLIGEYLEYLSLEHSRNRKMSDAANKLHVNFYETALSESRFYEEYENAKLLFGLLMGKIKEKKDRAEAI
jgi:hypothetical protein